MASIKVHAGDWAKGGYTYFFGQFTLRRQGAMLTETVLATDLEEVALASEDSMKKVGGAVGWGLVGGLALGPVGLLAGLVLGGNKKEVTFVAKFKDGRKMLATTDAKTFTKIQAVVF